MSPHQTGDHRTCTPGQCLVVRTNPTPVGPYRPPQPVRSNWIRS